MCVCVCLCVRVCVCACGVYFICIHDRRLMVRRCDGLESHAHHGEMCATLMFAISASSHRAGTEASDEEHLTMCKRV